MRSNIKRVFLLQAACLVVLFVSCGGEAKLDGSSDEAFKTSFEAVTRDLPAEHRERLGKAIMGEMFRSALLGDSGKEAVRKSLDGLTADELIARQKQRERESEAKAAELRERLAAQRATEIRGLEAKKQAAEEACTRLTAFEVLASRFYRKDDRWSTNDAVIELKVKNGTEHPVSRVYFSAVLQSPGRSVPWVESRFNYSIPGGLEPGEQAEWRLSPNMFGEWSRAPRDRSDMVLTVDVVRLDGADGEPLFDATEFTERDQERLDELRNQQPAATPR